MNKYFSSSVLILSNLNPIIGVIWFNWNLSTILFLYWFENIIIGFYNILKMRIAEKPIKMKLIMPKSHEYSVKEKNIALIYAFIIHFGLFTFGHGMFLYFIFLKSYTIDFYVTFSMIMLFLSHGFSYIFDYVNKKEYKNSSSDILMKDPYGRVLITHITVIIGSFYILKVGSQNIWPLIILTLIKTIVNLITHLKQDSRWLTKNISFK